VTSKLGKVLIAIRDAEPVPGSSVTASNPLKFLFTLSAARPASPALYVPQVGIINPSEFAPGNSIEAVSSRGRRSRHADRRGPRRRRRQLRQTYFTRPAGAVLAVMLGALFILVTLLLPKASSALQCLVGALKEKRKSSRKVPRAKTASANRTRRSERMNVMDTRATSAMLYLDACTSLRRLSRHQQSVAGARARRDARHHRPERRRQDHDDGHHHRQDQAGHRHRPVRRRH
jgi:urea transport system permease protein